MEKFIQCLCIFFLMVDFACAQNTVNITQRGNGNKTTVNRGSSRSNCDDALKTAKRGMNKIYVTNSIHDDTLFHASAKNSNSLRLQAKNGTIDAEQTGQFNNVMLDMIDYAAGSDVHSIQQGTQNSITAFIDRMVEKLSFLQSGNKNKIMVNPCGERNGRSSHNVAKVKQEGNNNSVNIVQH